MSGEYSGPARLEIPCNCGRGAAEWYVEPFVDAAGFSSTGTTIPGSFMCRQCRSVLSVYHQLNRVVFRPLVVTEGRA